MQAATFLIVGVACLVVPACATRTSPVIPGYLEQPFTAGIVRQYDGGHDRVVTAARRALGHHVLKVEQVKDGTAVIYGNAGAVNDPAIQAPGRYNGVMRIVVERGAPGRAVVRVLMPPRTGVPSDAAADQAESEVFRRIEQDLKR